MRRVFQPEWRTQNRLKRRFYAKYMGWLEKGGYFVVLCVFAAFVFAFNYKVDDVITADDVEIKAAATPITSGQPSLVERLLVDDGQEVEKGQALFTLIEGDESVRMGRLWSALESLRDVGAISAGSTQLAPPPRRTVTAPVAGVFRLRAKEGVVPAGEPIASIVDYGSLTIDAELEGNTVSKARAGLAARIVGISAEGGSGMVFRGGSPQGDILSSRWLDESVLKEVESRLKGSSARLRDDLPLEVDGVAQLQVDAHLDLVPATQAGQALQAEPPTDYAVAGRVASGTHLATVQVAALPPDVAERVAQAVRESAARQHVRTVRGQEFRVAGVRGVNVVVQLKAKADGKPSGPVLDATAVDRRYAAKITLESPPKFLVDEVRAADAQGRKVTARAEVVTGSRPIAFILLKKS